MTFTFAVKTLFIIFSIATAVCGFRAACLWYQSSLPTPDQFEQPQSSMSDDIEGHALYILVTLQSTQRTVTAASLLNKRAAKWSAWTAGSVQPRHSSPSSNDGSAES
jgi:hypothetical protein